MADTTTMKPLHFSVDLAAMLIECEQEHRNTGMADLGLAQGLQLARSLLFKTATRALELNDPKLNDLMCRLGLFKTEDGKNVEITEAPED
jgi:hypothetical protein